MSNGLDEAFRDLYFFYIGVYTAKIKQQINNAWWCEANAVIDHFHHLPVKVFFKVLNGPLDNWNWRHQRLCPNTVLNNDQQICGSRKCSDRTYKRNRFHINIYFTKEWQH